MGDRYFDTFDTSDFKSICADADWPAEGIADINPHRGLISKERAAPPATLTSVHKELVSWQGPNSSRMHEIHLIHACKSDESKYRQELSGSAATALRLVAGEGKGTAPFQCSGLDDTSTTCEAPWPHQRRCRTGRP